MNAPNITDSPDAPLAVRSSDLLGRVTENLILITAKMLEAKAVLQANAQWEAADEILTAYEAARRAQKIIEAKPRVKWCAHISTSLAGVWTFSGVPGQGSPEKIGKWMCCPICGTPRPNNH